ncbi:pseudaminic acid cytidylyltransferase [Salinisphaera dokdonensis CL-ES53]|uniref:Pseudaminic acid cytidylyltransferase n=1 Tax=Salinisphaera dokdonensis CL-ES53 TaxID=1304272 RepID=A0ABV2AW18_9GAMM
MRVFFRVDASLAIGTGHVMRCLTLAQALVAEGAKCEFICREHSGHMIEAIRSRGFSVRALSIGTRRINEKEAEPKTAHSAWLDSSWQEDAEQTRREIEYTAIDWLVVDHYALDRRWEEAVTPGGCRLLVIDDLADREHACDLLLDQNLGRLPMDYAPLVQPTCRCLIGPKYALLRPEFAQMREASLARRAAPRVQHLLVTLGGVDKDNSTLAVLAALQQCALPEDCTINVVMGVNAPWLNEVKDHAAKMPWATEVAVNVTNMAQRMCEADLAIGAAGSTSWERCCLGLPSVTVVLAENQRPVGRALQAVGASILIGLTEDIKHRLPDAYRAISGPEKLKGISDAAAATTDGNGVERLCFEMMGDGNERRDG